MLRRRLLTVGFAVVFAACSQDLRDEAGTSSVARSGMPQDLEAEVDGVRLHDLDWCGTGPVLPLIPGREKRQERLW